MFRPKRLCARHCVSAWYMVAAGLFLLNFVEKEAQAQPRQALSVSIVSIIADPVPLEGKRVTVLGCFAEEFEGRGIYLTPYHREIGDTANGLAIDIKGSSLSRDGLAKLNGKTVLVEGTVSVGRKGHKNAWAGGLHTVTYLAEWKAGEAALQHSPQIE